MFGGCGTAANAAIQRHDHDTEKRTARATFHVRDKAIQARENLSTAKVFGLIALSNRDQNAASMSVTRYLGSQFFDLVLEHKLLALERCNVQVIHCR